MARRATSRVTALLHARTNARDGRIDVRLQVRQRIDGGGVVQREQHVREHDRPAFGSLLAWTRLPRRSTDQHARIGRWNARLPIRRFVKSPLSRAIYRSTPCFLSPTLPLLVIAPYN